MKLIPASYRIPVIVAVIIHLTLIAALFIRHVGGGLSVAAKPPQAVKIVEAKTVSSAELNQQIQRIEHQQHEQKQQAQVEKLKREAQALKRARIREQQRVAKLKARRKRLQLAAKRRREKAEAKAKLAAKAKAEKALAKKRLSQKRLKMLEEKQKALTQKLLQQQLASEQKALSAQQDRALQGMLNRYTQKILGAISPNWIIPADVQSGAKATFLVTLAPGGAVMGVKLVKSSGNALLDRSCQVAIYKSSPLPVPKDPKLFDKLRELRLTLDPKDVIRL